MVLEFLSVVGQKIEYRNDSLFINNLFVDASIEKDVLDSLIGSSGKVKRSKDKFRRIKETGKKEKVKTVYYQDKGLFFRTFEHDSTKLMVRIKFTHDSDRKKNKKSELKRIFTGKLFIAGNHINDNLEVSQLKDLENCRLEMLYVSFGSKSERLGGELICMRNMIKLSFDDNTDYLTTLSILHNFKR